MYMYLVDITKGRVCYGVRVGHGCRSRDLAWLRLRSRRLLFPLRETLNSTCSLRKSVSHLAMSVIVSDSRDRSLMTQSECIERDGTPLANPSLPELMRPSLSSLKECSHKTYHGTFNIQERRINTYSMLANARL